ncbi:MAG: DUF6252 family protein [Bacteroidota bacterium]
MGRALTTIILFSFVVSCIMVTGCKKENNDNGQSISMTTKLDGHDWSTSVVYASYNSGYLSIVGSNPLLGTIMITVDEFTEGTYELGSDIHKFATYSNKDQIIFYTNPYGSGEITITSIDQESKYVTGTFNFIAKNLSGNPITATEGSFSSKYD